MTKPTKIYLALGDSMSIDEYTNVKGGGAVNQFHRTLGLNWNLIDKTFDGATMPGVQARVEENCDLITLTVGGNDLLIDQVRYLSEGLESFGERHLELLRLIRERNPNALLIVGNIYSSQGRLDRRQTKALNEANRLIGENVKEVDGKLADIHGAFRGNEQRYLCLNIEPTLEGARAIAELFRKAFESAN